MLFIAMAVPLHAEERADTAASMPREIPYSGDEYSPLKPVKGGPKPAGPFLSQGPLTPVASHPPKPALKPAPPIPE